MIMDSAPKAYRHCPNREVYDRRFTCLNHPEGRIIPLQAYYERRSMRELAEDLGCLACEFRNTLRPETPEPPHLVPDSPPN